MGHASNESKTLSAAVETSSSRFVDLYSTHVPILAATSNIDVDVQASARTKLMERCFSPKLVLKPRIRSHLPTIDSSFRLVRAEVP